MRKATVTALTGRRTAVVSIDAAGRDAESCHGCGMLAVCGVGCGSDSMEVDIMRGVAPSVGDRVDIAAPRVLTRRAVVILLLFPLGVLLGAVALVSYFGASEGAAVLSGLTALAAAFGALYVLRRRIERPIRWVLVRVC